MYEEEEGGLASQARGGSAVTVGSHARTASAASDISEASELMAEDDEVELV